MHLIDAMAKIDRELHEPHIGANVASLPNFFRIQRPDSADDGNFSGNLLIALHVHAQL